MADPGFQQEIGEELDYTQLTVSRFLTSKLNFVLQHADEWIKFLATEHARQEAKQRWAVKYNFPKVIDAIDCTHIPIEKPGVFGDEYVNREGTASVNVQTTCDHDYCKTSVQC